ncbi:unnamed protein product [Blepharisma stoltei]|uniref:Tetratricopeptide repeat protein n=1 Tax=Blepharisma stoltei TaxID=1481888 RepID=A0AAU9KAH3_9CILI|nr:unnamed protein product [Blepharisma stoltei]
MSNTKITVPAISTTNQAEEQKIEVLEQAAEKCADMGNFSKACQVYERIVQIKPSYEKGWTSLGHCYYIAQDYRKCYFAYQRALTIPRGNSNPQLWYGLGLLYLRFSSHNYAEMAFHEALKCDPNFEQKQTILLKLGVISKQALKYEDAIGLFKNCIQCDSEAISIVTQAYCCMGFCYHQLKRFGESLSSYRHAVSIEPNRYTLACLGWELYILGHYEEAHQCLELALDAEDQNQKYLDKLYYMLAMSHLQKNSIQNSSEFFEKILKNNQNDFHACCSYGILLAKEGKNAEALQILLKADQASVKGEFWINVGILYEQSKQNDDAIQAYQRALAIKSYELIAQERINEIGSGACKLSMMIHPQFDPTEFSASKPSPNISRNKDFAFGPPPELFAMHMMSFYQGFMNFIHNARNNLPPVEQNQSKQGGKPEGNHDEVQAAEILTGLNIEKSERTEDIGSKGRKRRKVN